MKINTNLMSAGKRLVFRVCFCFSLFFLQLSGQVQAQETGFSQSSPIPKFSLSATHQDSVLHPQAQFQKAKILDSSNQSMPWVHSPQAALRENGPLKALTPRTAESAKIATLPIVTPPQASEDRPNSYLEEYQVNWAPWIQTMANRWHRILKDSEELIGVEFHTTRPALIQFTCYADGRIGNVILRQSSGIPVYDRMQILSLKEIGQLDPFPPGTLRRSVTLIQGWESHRKRPGEEEFNSRAFANRYPQEKVNRWVTTQ